MPYFIYCRKSTESEDRQVLSIDSQISELRELGRKLDIDVSEVLTEAQSAKAPGRPVFQSMMDRLRQGEADGILCWKLDRLARNPIDGGALIWAIKENGIHIVTPTQSYSPQEDNLILMYIEFGFAQKYIDDLSRNVKRGLKAKLEQGWIPGRAPIGYLNDLQTKTVIPDPDRFLLVRRMWDLMLSGQYSGQEILDIANNEWGFRTPRGKRSGGVPLVVSVVYYILGNPFYAGWIIRNGNRYRGAHKPMITDAEFDQVQALLHRDLKRKPHQYFFPFTGLMRCAGCGCAITAEHKRNRQGHEYVYYRCTRKKTGANCRERSIEAKALEHELFRYLNKLDIRREYIAWARRWIEQEAQKEQESKQQIIRSLHTTKHTTDKYLSKLTQMRLRELVTDKEFTEERNRLLKGQREMEDQLSSAESDELQWKKPVSQVFDFAEIVLWWFQHGSEQDKRVIIDAIRSHLFIRSKKLDFQAKTPFKILTDSYNHLQPRSRGFGPLDLAMVQRKSGRYNKANSMMRGVMETIRTYFEKDPEAPRLKTQLDQVLGRFKSQYPQFSKEQKPSQGG